jgi:probable phosphoglycerate mutase
MTTREHRLQTSAVTLTAALALAWGFAGAAWSQGAGDFYRGKQIRLIVGHPVGNDHDVGGRLLAKYLARHIPGRPAVIVQNMTAAASVAAANYVFNQAPRDGTVFGTFSRNFPGQALMGQPNIEADPRRMQWLGATSFPARVCTSWHTSGVQNATDLFARDGREKSSLSFVASPLIRARATMELVRGELKLPRDGYALDDRLREIGYGQWEGSTLPEMQVRDPQLYAKRQTEKWTVSPPGGESYVEVQARMADWYASLTEDTVAVAHGGTARALMVALGIETPQSAGDLTIEQGAVYVFRDGGLQKYS